MLVTTRDTNKTYKVALRTWDGLQWLPDCADDLLTDFRQDTNQQDIDCLCHELAVFNMGVDLDWLTHCSNCQEVLLEIEEVHTND